MKIENIVFFAPCRITGGAEYYFVRLADYIAENHKEFRVYYTEFPDGFGHKVIKNQCIEFLEYTEGNRTIIPNNSLICMSLNFMPNLDSMATYDRSNTIIVNWFMHIQHLSYCYTMDNYWKVTPSYRRRAGEHINALIKLGALRFLGNLALLKLSRQYLFPYKPVETLPIPVSTDKYGIDFPFDREIGDKIRFCWLGRLYGEKVLNILTYMNELEEINKTHQVTLSLIGTGPEEDKLKKAAKKYSYPIEFVGEKREEDLDAFIRNNVDIGFASGTSSLEFAMRKVPVIQEKLLDRVYKAGERNTYLYVGASPVIDEDSEKGFHYEGQDYFAAKLNDILENYPARCEEVFNYTMSRSPKSCAEKFISSISALEDIDIEELYKHVDALNKLTIGALNNWMEFLHLRRIYVPICKLLKIKPAVI